MYRTFALAVIALTASTVINNEGRAAPVNHLLSQQQVLTFVAQSIDWYRQVPTAQRSGTDPADLLFLEDTRPITAAIVKLSFDFGKAVAAVQAQQNISVESASRDTRSVNSDLQPLMAAKARLDAASQEETKQLTSLTQARLTARRADSQKLETQIMHIRSRIQLLNAMSAHYQTLISYAEAASTGTDGATKLTALLENLERTVPDISAAASLQRPNVLGDGSRAPYGIMGMISEVLSLSRKQANVDGVIERTNTFSKSVQNVRRTFTRPLRDQFTALSSDAASLDVLQQQESRLSDLVSQAETASPAINALVKQQTLLSIYRAHLIDWRSEIQSQYRAAWKALIIRLGIVSGVIGLLLLINVLVRRLTYRHVHEQDTRQMLVFGERTFLWLIIIVVVLFAFAFDAASLATFLGLLSAGLAVGLHHVILAVAGYLVIVRKLHVRVGDRIHISGVSGDVTNLGLMQFELSEIDPATDQRTGRVALFSNSLVFVSPATPLFRRLAG